jgi:phosphopantetheine adenylyltransferase
VLVKEWADESGEPFKLYCRPITCYDLNELQKRHPNVMSNTSVASMVDLIVMKAEDQSGERLFKAEDRIDLMGEETAVISEIANQMFNNIVSAEAHEKNLEPI